MVLTGTTTLGSNTYTTSSYEYGDSGDTDATYTSSATVTSTSTEQYDPFADFIKVTSNKKGPRHTKPKKKRRK